MACHEAFTTYEAADLAFLQVTAQDASQRPYSRQKLYSTIATVLDDKANHPAAADDLTDTVESKLLDLKSPSITTTQIATTILVTLKHYDTSAFLRYLASHTNIKGSAELKRALKNY